MYSKRYGLFCLSLLILLFIAIPTFATHSWGGYHWERSSNPAQLTIYNSLSTDGISYDWGGHLSTAVADWNQSNVLNLTVLPGANDNKTRKRCTADTGTIRVCNAPYGNTGWLGIAGISVSGSHIVSGYTKVNDTYFSSSSYNTPEWRQMVMCQEIGHDFGLDHQDENFNNPPLGTCMDYTSDPTPNQHPNAHDYEELSNIYAHLDTSSGGGGSCFPPNHPSCRNGGNGINGSDFNHPSEWGQLVRSNGRIAVYERDFGNGNRIITFVIWAS